MQKGHALGSQQPGWTAPSAQLIQRLQSLLEVSQRETNTAAPESAPLALQGKLAEGDLLDVFPATFKAYRNGALVQTLTGHTNHNDLSLNGRVFSVDFGMTGIADGAYFPPVGWTYSNLKVVVEQ